MDLFFNHSFIDHHLAIAKLVVAQVDVHPEVTMTRELNSRGCVGRAAVELLCS